MELSSISKVDGNVFKFKWKSCNDENVEIVEEDQECEVRLRREESRKRGCKRSKLDFLLGDDLEVDCKAWVDEEVQVKVVFIGEQRIVTDQTVVVYGVSEKSTPNFENDATGEEEESDLPVESMDEDYEVEKQPIKYVPPAKSKPKRPTPSVPEDLKCPICAKICSSKRAFLTHKSKMHSEKPFVCPFKCGKAFRLKERMEEHITQHHLDISPFTCKECGGSYPNEWRLKAHMKNSHPAERKFVCEECGKRYKGKDCLRAHAVVHQEERPFNCDHPGCEFTFKTEAMLRSHSRTHLPPSERKFQCTEDGCTASFNRKPELETHMRRGHKFLAFRCDSPDCRSSFDTQKGLDKHKRWRGEKKRFYCDLCPCNYGHSWDLKKHVVAKHSGE